MKKVAFFLIISFFYSCDYSNDIDIEEDRTGWLCQKQVRDLNQSDDLVWKTRNVEHVGHSFDQIIYLFDSKIIHTRYKCLTIEP